MIAEERALLLEEEMLLIRHSGEIPEVALHASLCYMTEDADGPCLVLNDAELTALHEAVRDRYLEIILRDLNPDNRDLRLYRGMARAVVNWRRLMKFCHRTVLDLAGQRECIAQALLMFLTRELADVASGRRRSSLNCCAEEVAVFARGVGMEPASLPEGWEALACQMTEDR